jgi:aminopeptidase N
MKKNDPQTIYLKDYMPPTYSIESVNLTFELEEAMTIVHAHMNVMRNENKAVPLVLNGKKLELVSVAINEKKLSTKDYQVDDESLTIEKVPAVFTLDIVTRIKPNQNTELTGLYVSRGIFCTQCEAQGFRRMTYFLDRPDVMAKFTTTLIADKTRYPVLLSNGNPIKRGELSNNRHYVKWQDPFKKPSYLFALVAGPLECLEDKFVTQSGRTVALKVFAEQGQKDKCQYAMECIKLAMRWDEEKYGREYDLDIFMIVAISDFNMGAMENKGLNIFNSKYVLVKPETATDVDYEGVLLVVGHEYFHNWTGDRITCRDWFQLSLKEGLTVFREQQFTQDMTSHTVARIDEVRRLRDAQFKEDAGPLAHPVRPDSYIEINNFYTMTVYNKGSEVIRMLHTLLGEKLFRKGMDLYFDRHDGQAVTIEDFVKVFEDVSGRDFTQFRLWYSQSGTPELRTQFAYDQTKQIATLAVEQSCPATPGQPNKKPFHLPLVIGLLDKQGRELSSGQQILEIKNTKEIFEFKNIPEKPVPSLLRDFSAPVKLITDYSDADLYFLLQHDSNEFNRWEAAQQIASRLMLNFVGATGGRPREISNEFIQAFRTILTQKYNDESFIAELLTLPSESYLGECLSVIDVDGIHTAHQTTRHELAKNLFNEFLENYKKRISNTAYTIDKQAVGKRRLKNTCLYYLMQQADEEVKKLCLQQFQQANNMTDVIAALAAFNNTDCAEREEVLNQFYQKWHNDSLVMDKWFAIQASSELPGALTRVKKLTQHPDFDYKNPNRVRSVIGVFCQTNLVQFHAKNGEGYQFLTEEVLKMDRLNPQIAARLLQPMATWRRYDQQRQQLIQEQLQCIVNTSGISKDTYEIASKSLEKIK